MSPTNNPAITAYLKEARISAGMSQQEVSQKLGYSSSQFVSNWERGLAGVPLNKLAPLVKLLKLDRSRLMDLTIMSIRHELEQVLKTRPRSKHELR